MLALALLTENELRQIIGRAEQRLNELEKVKEKKEQEDVSFQATKEGTKKRKRKRLTPLRKKKTRSSKPKPKSLAKTATPGPALKEAMEFTRGPLYTSPPRIHPGSYLIYLYMFYIIKK